MNRTKPTHSGNASISTPPVAYGLKKGALRDPRNTGMTDNQPNTPKPTNPISNDALFAEPFKPAWMRRQEEDQRMELEWYVTKGIQIEWKKAAEESRRKLAAKYPPKKRKANSGHIANVDDNTSE